MPFPGERLAPRGAKKSWDIRKSKMVDELGMRVRVFSNGQDERLDVEVNENGNKRRIFTHDGPNAEVRGEGFIEGYKLGRQELKALTPQPKSKPGRRKETPAVTAPLTLKTATREQLVAALEVAAREQWDAAGWKATQPELDGSVLEYLRLGNKK